MVLYVCYGTFGTPEKHPCRRAYEALTNAGYEPEVARTFGCFRTDPLMPGRRKVKRLTGNYEVPVLELGDGSVIDGSKEIESWAKAHPAGPEPQ